MDEDAQAAPGDGAPGLSRRSLLLLSGAAAASTWLRSGGPRAPMQARVRTVAALAPAVAPARTLISLTAAASGTFERVRTGDDDTRLDLSYPSGAGVLTGQEATAPGFYGLDFTAYPAGQHAEQYLQDLLNAVRLPRVLLHNHRASAKKGSWSGKAAGLLAQGWNLVPIYVGRQQYWPHTTDNQISASMKTATTQGATDGKNAVALATGQKLPLKSQLYLDIEATQYPSGPSKGKNGPPTASTIAYLKAWLAAVNASGKFTGALYDANSRWKVGKTMYFDASEINSKLGTVAPATWVAWDPGVPPVGVKVGKWPLDANGDVAAVAVKAYSKNPQWAFAGFAQSWQFKLDWIPALTSPS